MAARPDGARRPMSTAGAVDRPRAEPRPFYPERRVSRVSRTASRLAVRRTTVVGRVRATMPPMARTTAGSVGRLDRRARRPSAARGAGRAGARPRPGPGRAADRRRRCCSAGRSSRCRRSASPSPSAGGCGRSGGSTRPTRRTRSRAGGRSRSSAGMLALAFALLSGIDRYDTTLFSVHMVQHVLLMLVAAPLLALGGADHARPAAELARDAPPLAPAGPPLAGRPVPGPPGRRLAHVRGDDVGGPLLAAVQRVARGPADPRPRARRCS